MRRDGKTSGSVRPSSHSEQLGLRGIPDSEAGPSERRAGVTRVREHCCVEKHLERTRLVSRHPNIKGLVPRLHALTLS